MDLFILSGFDWKTRDLAYGSACNVPASGAAPHSCLDVVVASADPRVFAEAAVVFSDVGGYCPAHAKAAASVVEGHHMLGSAHAAAGLDLEAPAREADLECGSGGVGLREAAVM